MNVLFMGLGVDKTVDGLGGLNVFSFYALLFLNL